MNEPSLSKVLA